MPKILVHDNSEAITQTLLKEWASWSEGEGVFLSGGTRFRSLYAAAPKTAASLFLVDERMVSHDSPDSTAGMLGTLYLNRFPDIDFHAPDTSRPDAAQAYEQDIEQWQASGGQFTVGLFGIGADGHTASLFPKQYAHDVQSPALVLQTEAEMQPFVSRITITPAFIQSLQRRIFVALGEGNRDIVRQIFLEQKSYPATDLSSDALVLMDQAAAADLPFELYDLV